MSTGGVLTLANSLIDRDTLGSGVHFPLTIDPATRDFKKVAYEENVKECIFWLLAVRVGERVMNEDVGTLIQGGLFKNIEALQSVLPHQIADAIATYEPRVTNVKIQTERTGQTELRITVTWTVRATGRRDNLVYPYFTDPPTTGGF